MNKKLTIMTASFLVAMPLTANADSCSDSVVKTKYTDLTKPTYLSGCTADSEYTSFDFNIGNLKNLCKKYECYNKNNCENTEGNCGTDTSDKNENGESDKKDEITSKPETPDADDKTETPDVSDKTDENISEYAMEVLELVNEERSKYSLPSLTYSKELESVAYAHSKDMSENNYFSHTDLSGKSPFDRLSESNISYRAAAENIAAGQKTPEEVMNSWMNSSGHRANILNSSVTEMAVGIYEGSNYRIYWTQMFIG